MTPNPIFGHFPKIRGIWCVRSPLYLILILWWSSTQHPCGLHHHHHPQQDDHQHLCRLLPARSSGKLEEKLLPTSQSPALQWAFEQKYENIEILIRRNVRMNVNNAFDPEYEYEGKIEPFLKGTPQAWRQAACLACQKWPPCQSDFLWWWWSGQRCKK